MSENTKARVLIIGAGSMGVVTGYYLHLAGAEVTFLIRPHREEALNRPQILYSYDDNALKTYKEYTYLTDPASIIGGNYDYIVITLDGASMRSETGVRLVKTVGEAGLRNADTKILLGTIFFDIRTWFLRVSGLAPERVTTCHLDISVYATRDVTLPLHPPTDPELLARSDFAYADKLAQGFTADSSSSSSGSPAVASGFAALWDACGISRCAVKPAAESGALIDSLFPIFAACELSGWPPFRDIAAADRELWSLVAASVKEIRGLGAHGEVGRQMARETTEESLAKWLVDWEKTLYPLDVQGHNRFHHGTKLKEQGRQHLRACLEAGAAEGKSMAALRELMRRVEANEA